MEGGLAELSKYLDQYGKDNDEEVKEVPFRLLGPNPSAGAPGAPGDTVFVPRKDIVDLKPPVGGRFVRVVTDYYKRGVQTFDANAKSADDALVRVTADPDKEKKIQDVDGKFRAYAEEPYDKVRWTFAPPVLINEGAKLQREWFYAFLNDPMPLRQQIRVRMPTFHYYEGEAGAIADYFAQTSRDRWPSRYARTLRLVLGMELKPPAKDASASETHGSTANELAWPNVMLRKQSFKGLSVEDVAKGANLEPRTVRGIEAGSRSDIDSGLEKLRAFGEKQGFRMQGPVGAAYERVSRRAPSYLEARKKEIADNRGPLALGHDVAIKGPNCYQCHFHQGDPPDQKESPIAWAPDLGRAHERLRESWTEDWLWNPGLVYPGTSMPGNFQGDPPQYQQAYPKSSNADQVHVVLDWLFNLDRMVPAAQ
jgi:hypothetical protein